MQKELRETHQVTVPRGPPPDTMGDCSSDFHVKKYSNSWLVICMVGFERAGDFVIVSTSVSLHREKKVQLRQAYKAGLAEFMVLLWSNQKLK